MGPVWRGGTEGEPGLLASCYQRSLALARQHKVRTLAFPAISCGVYGYPLEDAVAILEGGSHGLAFESSMMSMRPQPLHPATRNASWRRGARAKAFRLAPRWKN